MYKRQYVYKHLNLEELDYHPDNKAMISYIDKKSVKDIAASLSNVLETVTIPENPVIDELKHYLLENGAIGSLMSGSGPTTFGIFEEDVYKRQVHHIRNLPDNPELFCP